MSQQKTSLVFGASGQTGQHFVALALKEGHKVRALVRDPAKLFQHPELELHQGNITDVPDLDALLQGADYVVSMLGNAEMQKTDKVNTSFVKKLIPAMQRQGAKRFLYQAGGLSEPPHQKLSVPFQSGTRWPAAISVSTKTTRWSWNTWQTRRTISNRWCTVPGSARMGRPRAS